MKRSDLVPVILLVPVIGFVAAQAMQRSQFLATAQGNVLEAAASHHHVATIGGRGARVSRGGVMHVVARTEGGRSATAVGTEAVDGPNAAIATATAAGATTAPTLDEAAAAVPTRDIASIRRRIEDEEGGTYINDILLERDSSLARWPDRVSDPVRVWVANGSSLKDWNDAFADSVRDAFTEWASLGIPVRFQFVGDSAAAEVHVNWIDHFDTAISGKTLWARDRNWWIVGGNITLALHHTGGEGLDQSAMKAIALHEVGHLLGLDHTSDTTDIMTPRVRVRDLSAADRATMLLIYSVPPGSIRG